MVTLTDSTSVLKFAVTDLDYKKTAMQSSLMFDFKPRQCEKQQAIGLQ